jgi:ribosomal peptide maturation radical SAM protein 1
MTLNRKNSLATDTMNEPPTYDVVLINMPFTNLTAPSLALGLLQASLTRLGVSAKSFNFHLRFAETIGSDFYDVIETETYAEHLVGEWVFSGALFNHQCANDVEGFVRDILSVNTLDMPDEPVYKESLLEKLVPAIIEAKKHVEFFLDQCVETVLSHKPRIVGFTSLFQQHVASLALAKRIKSCCPDCVIVFGGANCEGMMGVENFRQFEFIDFLVSGEGDKVFPTIVESILAGKPVKALPGVFNRKHHVLQIANQLPQNTCVVENLDELPIPDYDDFFHQRGASSLDQEKEMTVLFETSRGCWWGEKLHCTFCGLNGSTMTYRSKSAERALDELLHLTKSYPGCRLNAVDNILDMKYFKTLIKFLADGDYDLGLFYEVKSNLKKDQLKLLRKAGVKTIQPGIESLSDNVLKVMRKGVTGLQNIQFIKWCAELDVKIVYNLIWGFPGECDEDYRKMIDLIPLLSHLKPPIGAGTIRIDRFSPNFNSHRELGFSNIIPFPAYGYVYPFDATIVNNLAYYFFPERPNINIDPKNAKELSFAIKRWIDDYQHSKLFYMDKGTDLLIWDWRPCAKKPLTAIDDYSRLTYLACDEARTVPQIVDSWRKTSATSVDEVRLKETLDSFVDQSLMIKDSGRYLALAYQMSDESIVYDA